MTLEFKFPEDQTNLLALDGTIYKIKLSYEADCAAQNQTLNVGACIDVVKGELEEALRAIVLMFINDQPLRPVTTRHFKFYTNRKPWRASRKLKFRYNGDDLETSEDFLDINVWTKQDASPGLRDFANCSKVCGDLSPHLSAQDYRNLAQNTSEINIRTRSGRRKRPTSSPGVVVDGRASKRKVEIRRSKIRGSPSKRKRINPVRKKSSANSRSAKRKKSILKRKKSISRRKPSKTRKFNYDWNFNNVVGKQTILPDSGTKRLVTRSQLNGALSGEEIPSTSTAAELKSTNVKSNPGPSRMSHQYNDNNNISTESGSQTSETQTASPVAKIRKRTLLRKAQLDQFLVQEEALAEESKLQQMAQPLRLSPRTTSQNKTKAPVQRSSLASTLGIILTPFKYLTRSMNR